MRHLSVVSMHLLTGASGGRARRNQCRHRAGATGSCGGANTWSLSRGRVCSHYLGSSGGRLQVRGRGFGGSGGRGDIIDDAREE